VLILRTGDVEIDSCDDVNRDVAFMEISKKVL
jgi:hypothetical protein